MLERIWPLIIIVASNCFYNICTKSTPEGINAFCALLITYLTAAAITAALFVFEVKPANAIDELLKVNWTSFVLGVAIVGLENRAFSKHATLPCAPCRCPHACRMVSPSCR